MVLTELQKGALGVAGLLGFLGLLSIKAKAEECEEGAIDVIEYCPDGVTPKVWRECVDGVWVEKLQECPTMPVCTSGDIEILEYCPEGITPKRFRECIDEQWVEKSQVCVLPECTEGERKDLRYCLYPADRLREWKECINGVWVKKTNICSTEPCPDICVGYTLYNQIRTEDGICGPSHIIENLSPTCNYFPPPAVPCSPYVVYAHDITKSGYQVYVHVLNFAGNPISGAYLTFPDSDNPQVDKYSTDADGVAASYLGTNFSQRMIIKASGYKQCEFITTIWPNGAGKAYNIVVYLQTVECSEGEEKYAVCNEPLSPDYGNRTPIKRCVGGEWENVSLPSGWCVPSVQCTCTDWSNAECIDTITGIRKQIRTCTPSGCAIEKQNVPDLSCIAPLECTAAVFQNDVVYSYDGTTILYGANTIYCKIGTIEVAGCSIWDNIYNYVRGKLGISAAELAFSKAVEAVNRYAISNQSSLMCARTSGGIHVMNPILTVGAINKMTNNYADRHTAAKLLIPDYNIELNVSGSWDGTKITLPIGTYVIRMVKDGYYPVSKTIHIKHDYTSLIIDVLMVPVGGLV